MPLQIFNVMGREKQPFHPLEEGRVTMYVCGPTVYDHAHIGHAKTYVSFDLIVRYLRYLGHDVLYVQNLTDVGHLLDTGEDRILKKARQSQALPMQLVETYSRSYFEDMDRLKVQRPDISPRASGHIPEQIEMIQELIDKGFAYESDGSVYFDVAKAPDYGKLSNRRIEAQEAGSREEVRGEKRNAEDFALWKKADPEHILRWDSPWSSGFPGWHIECSAMARKYLGPTFDIHGGGIDNIYPHNENEIVQSECANDAEFARYWMLVGSLNVAGDDGIPVKMSKSLGNFVTVKDALKKYRPEVIRSFVMGAHYSNPVTYSEEALNAAAAGWERLNGALRLVNLRMNDAPESDEANSFMDRLASAKTSFISAMDDDFNAPKAIASIQELTRDVNILLNNGSAIGLPVLSAIRETYSALAGDVLGIMPDSGVETTNNAEREAGLIQLLIDMRAQARANKDYAASDRIRDELKNLGVVLEDGAKGTIWRTE